MLSNAPEAAFTRTLASLPDPPVIDGSSANESTSSSTLSTSSLPVRLVPGILAFPSNVPADDKITAVPTCWASPPAAITLTPLLIPFANDCETVLTSWSDNLAALFAIALLGSSISVLIPSSPNSRKICPVALSVKFKELK